MDWNKLLSEDRLRDQTEKQSKKNPIRTEFERDYDSVVFSSAFRRLRDKTQVHSGGSDYVRTRISHSLEVSVVCRSLGKGLATKLNNKLSEKGKGSMPQVLTAAGLIHDIGHPPYGHTGEEKIRGFFRDFFEKHPHSLKKEEEKDFTHFDSNATSFSTVIRRSNWRDKGGLRLTYGVLATVCKYPYSSAHTEKGKEKFGFFLKDIESFREVAEKTGLIPLAYTKEGPNKWCRHPLAYLLEAADDICYRVVDLEDSIRLPEGENDPEKIKKIRDLLQELLESLEGRKEKELPKNPEDEISVLRGKVINALIHKTIELFMENYDKIMGGEEVGPLVSEENLGKPWKEIIDHTEEIYGKANERAGKADADETFERHLGELKNGDKKVDYDTVLNKLEYLVGCTERYLEARSQDSSGNNGT